MLTWSQLGVHRKPIGLFNVNGYFDHLIAFIDHMQQEDFIQADTRSLLVHDEDPDRLLEKMANYIPPALPAWLNNAGI
jgi:predicted Rossmann-fold nucleotide-binding protein